MKNSPVLGQWRTRWLCQGCYTHRDVLEGDGVSCPHCGDTRPAWSIAARTVRYSFLHRLLCLWRGLPAPRDHWEVKAPTYDGTERRR